MRRCSTDQSCNLKLCIMHRKIWVSCECNNKLDKYPFRSGSPWIRRCKRSGLDRCIYLRFCTGPSIWLEKIARFIFSYGGKSVKVSQTSNVQQLVGRKQNCQLYDVESTRSWVCKFFWDSRSVQNSPVYPAVQTHLPSVQVPPFMQMARQDLPSAPKDTVRPF